MLSIRQFYFRPFCRKVILKKYLGSLAISFTHRNSLEEGILVVNVLRIWDWEGGGGKERLLTESGGFCKFM